MATLTPSIISRSGTLVTLVSAGSTGDAFPNTGRDFVELFNGSIASITVSFLLQEEIDDVLPVPKTVVVLSGTRVKVGPFPTDAYNDSNGLVQMTYSSPTSLNVGVFRLTVEN